MKIFRSPVLLFKGNIATIAINLKAVSGPWGGASEFIWQLKESLEGIGFTVRFDLKKKVDLILIVDPREDLARTAFGLNEIKAYKKQHPHVKVIHRINECDKRKMTDFMDEILKQANEIADYTVFISSWLQTYFSDKWFNKKNPHCVIYNGANPAVYHPVGSNEYRPDEPLRLVTHHWSDNPMKGFSEYQNIDNLISDGKLNGFELWIIGRWPKSISWRSAKTFAPTHGIKLAGLLRQCHLYVTASLWEPGGMHHVEGAQCGLPLIGHEDGGGIVEAAEKYGMVFRDNITDVLTEAKIRYRDLREKVLLEMPSGYLMNAEYIKVIQYVLGRY